MYLWDKEVEVENCEKFFGQTSERWLGGWVCVCRVFFSVATLPEISRVVALFFAPHRTTRNTRVKWQRRRVSKFSIILRFSLLCTFCCCCQRSENGNDRGKVVTRQWYILMTFFSPVLFSGVAGGSLRLRMAKWNFVSCCSSWRFESLRAGGWKKVAKVVARNPAAINKTISPCVIYFILMCDNLQF